jgi:hypothetical protein
MVVPMPLKVPLGLSDFAEIREGGYTFVDKTPLIRDVIEDSAKVLLLCRPRRFGKTSNLSMLRYFFERAPSPRWDLFTGLSISQAPAEIRAHCGRYPVMALTFKDIKFDCYEDCLTAVGELLSGLYREHRYLLDAGTLMPEEVQRFTRILSGSASPALLGGALRDLSEQLHRHHGAPVVLLLDEYDTPLHTAFLKGYYEPAVTLFRNLLSGGLKDNRHLYKGIVTGVLRVAKDSMFTGLNNLDVYTLLRPEYADRFGFTEPEVQDLLAQGGCADRMDEVRRWYNGYLFGGQVIYNPWSVLSFLKSRDRLPRPFWAETSSNDLIRELLIDRGGGLDEDMERLLRSEVIDKPVIEQVALRELNEHPDHLWSFLLMSGYLKLLRLELRERQWYGQMALPNQEVQSIYETMLRAWWDQGLGGDRRRQALLKALLSGDVATAEQILSGWLLRHASMWDVAAYRPPERFYHGFVLGALVGLGDRYDVQSNPESGYGRCDVMLVPRQGGGAAAVLELKVAAEGESPAQALDQALRQVRERGYAEAARARGADPVHELAFVFDHKRAYGARAPANTG